MSLEKTTKETNRDYLHLEKHPVYEALPEYFEQEFPAFVNFLEKYYKHTFDTVPAKYLNDLEYKRDFVKAQESLLRYFSQELLLGREYYDTFVDKQTAIQVSNLLYRSKGTKFSIQMFFRVFFGFDVDVRYGRDETFIVGDPGKEELIYKSEYRNNVLFPGKRLRFKFDDGEIQFYAVAKLPQEKVTDGLYMLKDNGEYAEDQDDYVEPFVRELEYNVFFPLRQEVDYTIDYDDKSVVLQPIPDGYEPVIDDPWINELAETGIMPEGQSGKVLVKRYAPALSAIGYEVSDKRITNNGFWQMFSLAIRTPISIKLWREAYKDFIHPAGMYLEGETLVQTSNKVFGPQPAAIFEDYRKPVFSEDEILEKMQASITELNIAPFKAEQLHGYSQSGFVTNDRTPYSDVDPGGFDSIGAPVYVEERTDSQQPDRVYRTRINDIKNFSVSGFTLEELDTQYQRMDRIDTIDPRTFDNVEADLSGTINTLDENVWYGNPNTICESLDSSYEGPTVLGSLLDFPEEYAGCPGYIFNLFGLLRPLQAQYESPKYMDRNPVYVPGDSDGFGGGPFPYGIDSDGAGNPILMSDSDFRLGSIRGIQYRTVPGPVAGLGSGKITAYRDERVWGTTNDPGGSRPGQAFNFSDNVDSFGNPIGGTSRWDAELDYANPFQYVTLQGVARNMRTYFLNRDPITGATIGYITLLPGTPAPGDDSDYMEALIMVDSAGGTGIGGPAHLDSAFDSIGDVFP